MEYLSTAYAFIFGRSEPTTVVAIPDPSDLAAPSLENDFDIAELPSPKGLFSLPTRVLAWISDTFTIDVHPDGPGLYACIKRRSKLVPEMPLNTLLWALAKLDIFTLLDSRRCDCHRRCACNPPHFDSDIPPTCAGYCGLPEHFVHDELSDDECRLYLIIAASRTSCTDITHEQWYDLILECPSDALGCLYAHGREIFRVRTYHVQEVGDKYRSWHAMDRHMRNHSYEVAQFFHERGVIDATAQVLARKSLDKHGDPNAAREFFESSGRSIDELIANELKYIRYARPQYYNDRCRVGVMSDGSEFETVYDLKVIVDLLTFAKDNRLPVDRSAVSTHLRIWAKAPFCVEHLSELHLLGVVLPPLLHEPIIRAIQNRPCIYDCCGGGLEPDLSLVDENDLELVGLQSDRCRGRSYDSLIANKGDIVNAIMDLTM